MVLKKSTAVFAAVIIALLIVCVGLLVALLKNQNNLTLDEAAKTSTTKNSHDHHTSSATSGQTVPNQYPSTPAPTELPPGQWDNNRLTRNIIPTEYDLTLHPDLNNSKYEGEVFILVQVENATDVFIVHCHSKKKLNIHLAELVVVADNTVLKPIKETYHEINEYYIMIMKKAVQPGSYKMHFKFNGTLEGSIVGFYKSTYKDPKTGLDRHLATSKFQPTFARRAFPCFDEPGFKAKFTVKLSHEKDYIALSNMPVVRTSKMSNGQMLTEFKQSVPMVTYLACFIVCDFDHKEATTDNQKKFRVYARPDQIEKTQKALEYGVDILNYYEKYFGIEYPLDKQDMIAIPDFSSGAMEHWGLITYRETNLLYDAKESSPQNLQRVASVISHELAHMWFGNLVTMNWWDDLWLNEGFASYIEYKGVNEIEGKWNMMDQLLTEDIQPVIRIDATTSSHPIIQAVNTPDQITEIFDAISYNKGAAILRMLESFVTPKKFQTGISNFLKNNNYSNAETHQLWEELRLVSGMPISDIMDTWTKQMGLPYLTVNRIDVNKFSVKQQRFLLNPKMQYRNSESEFGYIWKIPLSYTTSANKTGLIWVESNDTVNIEIPDLKPSEWVKFNTDQTGYYIVNYARDEWDRFSKMLIEKHESLSASDRSNLLFDSFQLAQHGALDYEVPLRMTTYLMNEKELTPWETAYGSLVQLGQLLQNKPAYDEYKTYINELTQPLYRTLGWKDQAEHKDSLLQTTIIGLACFSGNKDCRQQAVLKLKALKDGEDSEIPLALRNIVFKYAMEESGDTEMWEFMWDRYEKEGSAQEKIKLLYGLAHVQDTTLISQLLDNSMNSSLVRDQDFFTVISYVAGNPVGRDVVWEFLRKNWDKLVKKFTLNDRNLGRAVKSICDYFNTEEKLKEMEDFFAANPNAGAGERARNQTLENVKNNIRWLNQNQMKVNDWLKKDSWSDYRLSDKVIPLKYNLWLHPELEKDTLTFDGKVEILVDVKEETDLFIVHIYNLDVKKTEVIQVDATNTILPYKSTFAHKANDFWVTEMENPVPKNTKILLKYEFSGFLNNSLVGMYRSSYTKKDGTKRYLITSQFQSTYARRAFPCFDEPKFKSKFTVTLKHPKGYTALSNMPPANAPIDIDDNWQETKFEESVDMVTYLVCVIISDFNHLAGTTKSGKEVRVFARADESPKTQYALDVGIKTLDHFEEYFKIPYPLPKLDMVAVPDFQAGAMENWGLVTYRETLLIYDKDATSPYNQLRIAAVIGHELAHMWFGNLVTMKWWNDLWLNEGFASYIEYKSMEKIEPTWDINAQMYLEDIYRVLQPDASISSHPIVQEVNHPDEITALFDAISYSKGASVLRMLESFLGNNVFQEGVTKYLSEFQYKNAETQDLWDNLQKVTPTETGVNVTIIMDTWTKQMGYPYLNLTKKVNQDNTISYEFVQKRFLLDPDIKPDNKSPYNYVWHIPITYVNSVERTTSKIFWMTEKTKTIPLPASTKIAKFNSNHNGYYIVNYQDEWASIIDSLNSNHEKDYTQADRANLISDAFLLARAGLLNYTTALDLTKYLKEEESFVPWETARKLMSYLINTLEQNQNVDGNLKAYMDTLSSGVLEKLTWDPITDHLKRRLRETLVDVSCKSENPQCMAKMAEYLQAWKTSKTPPPSDLKLLVYKFGMKEIGDKEMWDHMWDEYTKEGSSQEQKDLLMGLSSTRDAKLLQKLIENAETEEYVRKQDYFTLMSYIAGNPIGLPIVWKYFQDNWLNLVKRFTLNDRYLGDAVKSICNHFTTQERLDEMVSFFGKYPEAGAGERSRQEALTNVQNNIKWLRRYQDTIQNWLEKQEKQLWHNIRLPEHIIPEHYHLQLQPDINAGTFTGKVDIDVRVAKKEKYFLVHVNMLNVLKTEVEDGLGNVLDIAKTYLYKRNEFWVVELKDEVEPGYYKLKFEFEGSLTGGLVGFYRSSYLDEETNSTKLLATSQFQSTYARRAFPCFDEPSIKSIFTVTLVHEEHMTALSNMPPKETRPSVVPNLKETEFEPSVRMVTYLVCVIVCEFESKEMVLASTNGKDIKIKVYAPSDRVDKTEFALNVSAEILRYFENYFGIAYPLPKLDMIALPDFRAGAMENWGIITYREIYLLFDKQQTSPSVEFSIVMIIAHEIAHMWFGNLVTMKWWDDLWLNEGFATFMAYKCVSNVRPDMGAIDLFLLGETADVLEPDATRSSHPIVQVVKHPDEISAIFDAISYSKGASVLRMLESYLQPDVFQTGLQKYLEKHKYANAKTEDLWIELAANGEVSEVMDTWTKQMGYPVVDVKISEDGKKANLSQNRFLLNPGAVSTGSDVSPYNYIWKIPVHIDKKEKSNLIWLNDTEDSIDITKYVPSNGKLLKWNFDQSGYFLVNYDETTWLKWATELQSNSKLLSSTDLSNLLSDAFLLARGGNLSYSTTLELTKYLKNEKNFNVWTTAKSGLLTVSHLLEGDQNSHSKMLDYLRSITDELYRYLGWIDDPDSEYLTRRLRTAIADLACRADNKNCIEEASKILGDFLETEKPIPAALRTLVYRYGLWGDDKLWEQLWEVYLDENTAQGKRDLLYGLAFTQNTDQLKRYIELAQDESNVRAQDFFSVITSVANNPKGLQIAWDFLRDNWQFLVDRYSVNDRSIGNAFLSVSSHFSSTKRLQEMKKFFADNPEAGAGKASREESVEIVQNNINWIQHNLPTVKKWLDELNPAVAVAG